MMLDKFKNIVNLNNSGAEKDEAKKAEANENPEAGAPVPGDPSLEGAEEKTFFDEMLGAPQYTYEQFLKVLKSPQEERGDTDDLKKHWGYPRRWKVILWDLQIQNYMNSDFNAFVDFDFGGNREECRIQRGSSMKIYAKGKTKNCLRTHVVSNVAAEQKKNMNFRSVFEYRGSYLDLENEKLRIKVWEYKQFTLNKLEGIYEEPLLSFAVGQIYNETTLYKYMKDTRVKRCRLFFQLYFQELYDFELSFLNWSFSDLLSYTYIQAKSLKYVEDDPEKLGRRINKSGRCHIFPKGGTCVKVKKLNKKKKKKIENKNTEYGIGMNSSFNSALSEDSERNNKNGQQNSAGAKYKNDRQARNLEKLFFRNVSLMQNVEENEQVSYKNVNNVHLPNPRVTITLTHTPKGHEGLTLVSMEQKAICFPVWENLGEMYFRGTLRDIDVSYLNVSARGGCTPGGGESGTLLCAQAVPPQLLTSPLQSLLLSYFPPPQIKVEDMSAPKSSREIGMCQIPLKGVVDYPYVAHQLEAPPWLIEEAKYEGWESKLEEWKLGTVDGKVIIARVPRYRQMGDIYHLDCRYAYLIVHIFNIDQIVTVDNVKELDTYVEVSFDETSRRTRFVRKTLSPNYDSQIAIPMRFNHKNQVNYQNFSKKGRIYIDVWGKADDIVYVGGVSITPYEIFFNEKNVRRMKSKLEHIDLETNVKTPYETVVYRGCKKLLFLHDDQRISNIHFSVWTYPDVLSSDENNPVVAPPVFSTTKNFPTRLAEKYEKLKGLYFQVLKTIRGIPEGCTDIYKTKRFFNYELLNQRKESHFLPSLITSVKSPYGAESTNAIFHYVRCIPFIHKKDNIAFTPDFTLQLKGGNALDHSLLLCSLFLGIPVISFVCFGTLWDNQKHAWVCTFEYNEEKNYGMIKFWETTTGNVYTLKKRFSDMNKLKSLEIKLSESKYKSHLRHGFLQKSGMSTNDVNRIKEETKRQIKELFNNRVTDIPIGGPSVPYKTIDLIFNNKNIFLNLQDPNPLNIWYDYWRVDLWFPFSSIDYNIQPCFTIKNYSHKIEDMELDRLAKELRSNIEKNINIYRASRNLSTRWNRDETLELFLQVGLELLHQLNTSRKEDALLAKLKIEDWKKALYHKVPQSHRLLGFPYHFNTCKSKFISDKLISTLAILESRDRSLCLSLAVCLYSLPGDFISAYIYIITCVKITQRELRKMEIVKEKAQRKAEMKNARKKQKGSPENADAPTVDAIDVDALAEHNLEETLKEDAYGEMDVKFDSPNQEASSQGQANEQSRELAQAGDANLDLLETHSNDEREQVESTQNAGRGSKKKKLKKSVDLINLLLAVKKEGGRKKGESNNAESNNEGENPLEDTPLGNPQEGLTHLKEGDSNQNEATQNVSTPEEGVDRPPEELRKDDQLAEEAPERDAPVVSLKGSIIAADSTDWREGKREDTKELKRKKKEKRKEKEKEKEAKSERKRDREKDTKSERDKKQLEFEKLIKSNNYFEKEKKKLQEDIEKLEREKEEFKKQKMLREQKEKQMLLEEKLKLEKEKEQFENEKLERKMSYMLKVNEWERKEKERRREEEERRREEEERRRKEEEEYRKMTEKKTHALEEEKKKKKKKKKKEETHRKKRWEGMSSAEGEEEADREAKKEREREIERQREHEREIEKERERQMEREMDREISRQIGRKTGRDVEAQPSVREKYSDTNELSELSSFGEELDLNQIYSKTSNLDDLNEKKKKKIRVHTNRKENTASTSNLSKDMDEVKNEMDDNPNIARYLYGKTKNRNAGKKNYNYDEPHYGKSMNEMTYTEMKKSDLFKGFADPSSGKAKKKIVLVKRKG
ncbi:double C2-like domain-containing protein, putative [Plasmodium vivax]|uniref:Double C2-like domain-containing protein, putative n=1 Tax=Plasmodium vivax TaxID=5855 RepID=A0A565A2Z5_PLAVI|nr:double C2-like domain-containing protein, putative [Plasmodium vivax]